MKLLFKMWIITLLHLIQANSPRNHCLILKTPTLTLLQRPPKNSSATVNSSSSATV